jgi:hypothetical protein
MISPIDVLEVDVLVVDVLELDVLGAPNTSIISLFCHCASPYPPVCCELGNLSISFKPANSYLFFG